MNTLTSPQRGGSERVGVAVISPSRDDTERLVVAANWLQLLRSESADKRVIDEWIVWSANPDNLSAFEKVSAIGQATATLQFRSLHAYPRSRSRSVSGVLAVRLDSPAARPLSQADIAALIEQNYVGLRLLVARRCRDPQVAADLLNEAVCTTWSKWQAGMLERPEQIAGYVLQITMNLLRNHRRATGESRETRAGVATLQNHQSDAEPDDQTIEREIAVQVKKVIHGMSSQQDQAILARYYLDEEEKETICRDLGLSPLQFDKILHRARGRLRKLLESGGLGKSDLF